MKAGSVFQGIACRVGKHRLFIVEKISEQAAKVECNYCHKQWAIKMDGDCQDSMIPWVEAQFFYTDERVKRALEEK